MFSSGENFYKFPHFGNAIIVSNCDLITSFVKGCFLQFATYSVYIIYIISKYKCLVFPGNGGRGPGPTRGSGFCSRRPVLLLHANVCFVLLACLFVSTFPSLLVLSLNQGNILIFKPLFPSLNFDSSIGRQSVSCLVPTTSN